MEIQREKMRDEDESDESHNRCSRLRFYEPKVKRMSSSSMTTPMVLPSYHHCGAHSEGGGAFLTGLHGHVVGHNDNVAAFGVLWGLHVHTPRQHPHVVGPYWARNVVPVDCCEARCEMQRALGKYCEFSLPPQVLRAKTYTTASIANILV